MTEAVGYTLTINPTYIVALADTEKRPRWSPLSRQISNANLSTNTTKGLLSAKAQQRMRNAVNWLIASSKRKFVWSKAEKRGFMFRVNFITLTIPGTDQVVSDKEFTRKMLHGFINQLYYHAQVTNYVWRVEPQANGNIHAHFITDRFIHHAKLRSIWNKILHKAGVLDQYINKHSALSWSEYLQLYPPSSKRTISQLKRAFNYGVSTGWSHPNTTDVHSVRNVKSLGAYVAKYMSKADESRRPLKCRLWGCSYSLSSTRKCQAYVSVYDDKNVLNSLFRSRIPRKELTSKPNRLGSVFRFGHIFLLQASDWGKQITGLLHQVYNDFRFYIRNGLTHTQTGEPAPAG